MVEVTLIELERYPHCCAECPMFSKHPYCCHNETGMEGECKLGYMKGDDMRDFDGDSLYRKCGLFQDPKIRVRRD